MKKEVEEAVAALNLTASQPPVVSKPPAILFTHYFVYRNPHEHLDEALIISQANTHVHLHPFMLLAELARYLPCFLSQLQCSLRSLFVLQH